MRSIRIGVESLNPVQSGGSLSSPKTAGIGFGELLAQLLPAVATVRNQTGDKAQSEVNTGEMTIEPAAEELETTVPDTKVSTKNALLQQLAILLALNGYHELMMNDGETSSEVETLAGTAHPPHSEFTVEHTAGQLMLDGDKDAVSASGQRPENQVVPGVSPSGTAEHSYTLQTKPETVHIGVPGRAKAVNVPAADAVQTFPQSLRPAAHTENRSSVTGEPVPVPGARPQQPETDPIISTDGQNQQAELSQHSQRFEYGWFQYRQPEAEAVSVVNYRQTTAARPAVPSIMVVRPNLEINSLQPVSPNQLVAGVDEESTETEALQTSSKPAENAVGTVPEPDPAQADTQSLMMVKTGNAGEKDEFWQNESDTLAFEQTEQLDLETAVYREGDADRTGIVRTDADRSRAETVQRGAGEILPRPSAVTAELTPVGAINTGEVGQPEQPDPVSGGPSFLSEMRETIITQMVEHMHVQLDGQEKQVHIRLKPEYLGDVRITLTVRHGMVSAEITAQNQLTSEIIQSAIPELRLNLQQLGVDLGEVNVGCNSQEQQSGFTGERRHQQNRQSRFEAKLTEIHLGVNHDSLLRVNLRV